MRLITRREAVRWLSSASAAAWLAGHTALKLGSAPAFGERSREDSSPSLASGAPTSPEQMALIEAFRKRSEGLQNKFEACTHKSDWKMPYRLFRPEAARGKIPLVVYLHGSGGLGDDNLKQLAFGNIFGTRLWLLPENQKAFPCYVVAPQTDRGWIRYDFSQQPAKELPGLGNGNRLALEIVDSLGREFGIDERRIYVAENSMGGAGVWDMLGNRPNFFAAAVICCGGVSPDDGTGSIETALWDFHGDADEVVPVPSSRNRIAARRKWAGTRSTPSTREWITTARPDWRSPNRRCQSGFSRNAESDTSVREPRGRALLPHIGFPQLPKGFICHESPTILAASCDCLTSLCRRYDWNDGSRESRAVSLDANAIPLSGS